MPSLVRSETRVKMTPWCTTEVYLSTVPLRDFERGKSFRIKDLRNGGGPTSHTPALDVPAMAAPFRA